MDVPSYLLGKKAGGGGSYTETDPIFGASPASTITTEDIENWNNSGGGASYTAGTNIEITNDNVINNTIPFKLANNGWTMALGQGAQATNYSISYGYNSSATGTTSVALGSQSQVFSNSGLALGTNASVGANHVGSIALGHYAATEKANQLIIGGNGNDSYINEAKIYTSSGAKTLATTDYLTTITGYDATKTQVLKNVNGTFTWVDE